MKRQLHQFLLLAMMTVLCAPAWGQDTTPNANDALALRQKGEILAQIRGTKRGQSSYHLPRFGPMSDWTTGSCFHVNGGKMSNAF